MNAVAVTLGCGGAMAGARPRSSAVRSAKGESGLRKVIVTTRTMIMTSSWSGAAVVVPQIFTAGKVRGRAALTHGPRPRTN
jgi:hypothetical protein